MPFQLFIIYMVDRLSKFPRKKRGKPIILVSNDDGVRAKGLVYLSRSLKSLGRVVVVAPDQQRSAASHSITLHRPLRVNRISEDVYETDGTPTDCIVLGVHEILRNRPDIIVSGINHGANLGDDIHYSGTVSAAFEGGLLGVPSVAISVAANGASHFDGAAAFAVKIAKKILKEGLPKGIILNINVPDIPQEKIRGYEFTNQGRLGYGDVIVEKLDPRGRKYYWIGGDEARFEDIEGSDCNAIRGQKISVTPLRVNLTDFGALEELKEWKL